jgi:predicted nuclease of predicted toxin-antitoxin system
LLLLTLLADENIPKKLTLLLRGRGVDIIRLQDFGAPGLGDRELVNIANRLGRAILTRDHDFTIPYFLSLVKNGVIYISYQPSKTEIMELVDRIAASS